MNSRYTIGIDEVGRGPVAGPVCVCVSFLRADFEEKFNQVTTGIRDSKKMTEKKRKEWLELFKEWQKEGWFDFVIKNKTASAIDRLGISQCLKKCIEEGLKEISEKIEPNSEIKIYLDGSLKAPQEFINQETIIKGDEKIPLISTASIIAKVFRDTYMEKLQKQMQEAKMPDYGFDKHKGYGTKTHLEAISKYGLSKYHRKSFLKNFLPKNK